MLFHVFSTSIHTPYPVSHPKSKNETTALEYIEGVVWGLFFALGKFSISGILIPEIGVLSPFFYS
nr:hypothetical protein [Helicobacter pylori]